MKSKRTKHSLPRYIELLLGILADGQPHTLKQLSDKLDLQETTVTTYLSILRNVYGFEIERKYTGKAGKRQINSYRLKG